jgi:C4-dicarboxylate transporter DctQ subunit
LFAPFVLMMIVVTLRYIWRIYTVLRFGPPETEMEALLTGKGAVSEEDQ